MNPFKLMIILMVFIPISVFGQDFTPFDCPIIHNNETLKYPFTGGFNAPQFSNGDFNQDGIMDIFAFDRIGAVPMVFTYEGSGLSEAYNLDRQYQRSFPDTLINWALSRDFNRDNIPDLFVAPTFAQLSSAQLYEGYYDNGILRYRIRRMGSPFADENDFEFLFYSVGSQWFTSSVPFTDIPEIIDVDNDGDLDLLSFDLSGSFVVYYKNMQEEEGLSRDSMRFEIGDFCFGKFMESGVSGSISLSNDPEQCASRLKDNDDHLRGGGGVHAGSTIMGFDDGLDGDIDLVLGDLSSGLLVFAENGGTPEESFMTNWENNFPTYDVGVNMPFFLGSFNVDVNGDGLKDMLVSPNSTGLSQNFENVLYYQNTGIANELFNFRSNRFLIEETIDFGSLSEPLFVDENADGLMDMLIATNGFFGNDTPIEGMFLVLYRNTGTASSPEYTLVDDNYLDFNELTTTSSNPHPAIGDIDGDGDMDLLIGLMDGNLYLYENTAGPNQPFNFQLRINYMDINIGPRGKPEIADLNGDGLADILIGERTVNVNNTDPDDVYFGSIAYYENIGELGNPQFNPDLASLPNNPALGRIRTSITNSNFDRNNSAPHTVMVGDDVHLLIGSSPGNIKRYLVNQDNLGAQFELLDSIVGGINEGWNTTLSTADIDNDGFLEMVIGNERGGIGLYNTDFQSLSTSTEDISAKTIGISLYPNPSSNTVNIKYTNLNQFQKLSVYNISGQLTMSTTQPLEVLDVSDYPNGIYTFRLETKEGIQVERLVKI